MTKVKDATDQSFQNEVALSTGTFIVDFHASWCAPCQRMHSVLNDVSTEADITVIKVDVEAAPNTAAEHGVRSLPTLVLYKNGKMHAVRSGASGKAEVLKWVTES